MNIKNFPLVLIVLVALHSKAAAQFKAPLEDLIMGKTCDWTIRTSENTIGQCANPFVYYNDRYLIYHYETQNGPRNIFYTITKKVEGADFTFCGDSCVVLRCYDSALSYYLQKGGKLDFGPTVKIVVNYGAGSTTEYPDGRSVTERHIDVTIITANTIGSFDTENRKTSKQLIPTLLPKLKKLLYQADPADGVSFTHTTFNWSKLKFQGNNFSMVPTSLKKDSINLVIKKHYYDSLLLHGN